MSDLLTPVEVADQLGVPVRRLEQWRYQRTGPSFVHVGRNVRYRAADLEAWLQANTIECEQ